MEFAEEIRDFLIESSENLAMLDQQMVELEKNPSDEALIAGVFRTIHTVKGTSGFFGFNILGGITHIAENILGQVREKERTLTPALVSLVLQTADAVKLLLQDIEATGQEGEDHYQPLRDLLNEAYLEDTKQVAALPTAPATTSAIASATVATTVAAATSAAKPVTRQSARRKERRNTERLVQEELDKLEAEMLESAPGQAIDSPVAAAEAARISAEAVEAASREAAQEPSAAPEEAPIRRHDDSPAANSTIRVDVTLLDKLMNLVGELVLARNQILQGAATLATNSAAAQRLNLITSELQQGVMRTRMQPIGVVWNKLPRVVRDLASAMSKEIEIEMEGAGTELDKTIIEAIKDPLTHIVRNSCDHGIESREQRIAKGKNPRGTILLRAFHEGGHVNIEISDDGAGIDAEKVKLKAIQKGLIRAEQAAQMGEWESLRLIFLPGFSTAEKVTNISGRGVGMDVVKTNIERISGSVDLSNRPGGGSIIKIKIPLTLAIIPGLIVSVRNTSQEARIEANPEAAADGAGSIALEEPSSEEHRFVIPQANLLELVRLEGEKGRRQIERIHGAEVFRRRGKLLPLAYLSEMLGLTTPATQANGVPGSRPLRDVINIVVVQAEETAFGLVVDEVNDTQEIVVKALGKQLKMLTCYLGATIMGDGKIALILDVAGLARLANVLTLERTKTETRATDRTTQQNQVLLLFRAGKFARLVLPLSLVARLEEIPAARVEQAGGRPVLRYREAIMPLLSLSSLLDPGSNDASKDGTDTAQSLQVIVFSEGDQYVGLVVDEILDIVDELVSVKRAGTSFGLLGSGVVGGKVADFVDLAAVLAGAFAGGTGAFAATASSVQKMEKTSAEETGRQETGWQETAPGHPGAQTHHLALEPALVSTMHAVGVSL